MDTASFVFLAYLFVCVGCLFNVRVNWSQLLRKEPALSETADAQTVSHCTVVAMVGS